MSVANPPLPPNREPSLWLAKNMSFPASSLQGQSWVIKNRTGLCLQPALEAAIADQASRGI